MAPRTASDRLKTVNEVKLMLMEHNLQQDPACKVLWLILDNYHKTGTSVRATELPLKLRYDQPRKLVVTLANDTKVRDTVLLRPING